MTPIDRLDDAAALLARLEDDPRAAAEMQRRYDGRHDIVSALWWRVHPGTRAPSGLPDPRDERDRLAAVAYGRKGSAAELAELAELESALARDEAVVDALLERWAAKTTGTTTNEHATATEPADPAVSLIDAGRTHGADAVHAVDDGVGEAPRVPRLRRAVLTTVLVLVLVAATAVLSVRLASAEASLSGAPPTSGSDPLARFDLRQAADDVPEVSLPYDYVPTSIRRLLRPDQVGLSDDYVLYGARTERDEVCLILVFPDENTASSCVSLVEYRRNGVRVSANVLRTSRASLGSLIPVAHTVTWQSDGAFQFSSALAERLP